MSILVFAFLAAFGLVLLFVVASAARRGAHGNRPRRGGDSMTWFGDGGAGFSDAGADCSSGGDGGGSCDGGGGH